MAPPAEWDGMQDLNVCTSATERLNLFQGLQAFEVDQHQRGAKGYEWGKRDGTQERGVEAEYQVKLPERRIVPPRDARLSLWDNHKRTGSNIRRRPNSELILWRVMIYFSSGTSNPGVVTPQTGVAKRRCEI